MSGYKVEEEDETYIINSDGTECNEYWRMYSEYQRKRLTKVHRQMFDIWFSIECQMRLFISFDIPTNDLMLRISKIFLLELKNSTQQMNDIKQRNISSKNYKKRLMKLRTASKPL